MKTDTRDTLDRRAFLRSATGIATIGASAVVVSTAEAYDPGKGETHSKYQPESPDVQAFYRTNGYEALRKK